MVKILSQEVKECENSDGTKTLVLEIFYKIKKETGRFLLKNYNATNKKEHNNLLKQFKEVALKQYLEFNPN